MIPRRHFLASLAASVAGGTITEAAREALAPPGCARTFRKDANGEYYEIDRHEVKAGDEIIMIGINDETGRLWKTHHLKVTKGFEETKQPAYPKDVHGQVEGAQTDLKSEDVSDILR